MRKKLVCIVNKKRYNKLFIQSLSADLVGIYSFKKKRKNNDM